MALVTPVQEASHLHAERGAQSDKRTQRDVHRRRLYLLEVARVEPRFLGRSFLGPPKAGAFSTQNRS